MKHSTPETLPLLIAGPILRKTTKDEVVIWVVTSQPLLGTVSLYHRDQDDAFISQSWLSSKACELVFQLG